MLQHLKSYFRDIDLEALTGQAIATLVILGVALILYAVVARAIGRLRKSIHLDEASVFYLRRIARWSAVLLAGAALLQVWGVLANVWAAATAMVTLVSIGFVAVWSVLSNVLCGIILLSARPFRIGDTIELPPDDVHGKVVDINLLQTELLNDDGTRFQVPNNLFFQRVVKCVNDQTKMERADDES